MRRFDILMLGLTVGALALALVALIVASVGHHKAHNHDHGDVPAHTHNLTVHSQRVPFSTRIGARTLVNFNPPYFSNVPSMVVHKALNEKGDPIGTLEVGWDNAQFSYNTGTSWWQHDKAAFADGVLGANEHLDVQLSWVRDPDIGMVPAVFSVNAAGAPPNPLYMTVAYDEFPEHVNHWPPSDHSEDHAFGISTTNYAVLNNPNTHMPIVVAVVGANLISYHVNAHANHHKVTWSHVVGPTISAIASGTIPISLTIINNEPAVAFVTTGNACQYSRYNSTANTWSAPVTVSGIFTVNIGPSLTSVSNLPTIAYNDLATPAINVIQSTHVDGEALGDWTNGPTVVDSTRITKQAVIAESEFGTLTLFVNQVGAGPSDRVFVRQDFTDPTVQGTDVLGIAVPTLAGPGAFWVQKDMHGGLWMAALKEQSAAPQEWILSLSRHNGGVSFNTTNWPSTTHINVAGKWNMGNIDQRPALVYAEKVGAGQPEKFFINLFGRLARVADGECFAHDPTPVQPHVQPTMVPPATVTTTG